MTSHPVAGTRTDSDFEPPTVGLLGVARILIKWSFVVAPLAALTIWIALSQSEGIEPEYLAEASVLLVGPNELIVENFETGETTVEEVNPLQNLGGTLGTVAQVTTLAMSDPSVATQLESEGLSLNHNVWVDGRAPIVRMEAFHSNPEIANRTVERLTTMVFDGLEDLQDSLEAPDTYRIGAKRVSSGLVGGPDFGARTRFRLAVVAVGFALSAASAFVLEGLVEYWHRRRRRDQHNAQLALPSGERSTPRERQDRFRRASTMIDAERISLVGVVHLLTGDDSLAENIASTAATEAEDRWHLIRSDHPVEWLYGHAVRLASEHPNRELPDADDGSLWAQVQSMPSEMQQVLALSSVAQLTDESIATALDLDVGVVRAQRVDASLILAASIAQPANGPNSSMDEDGAGNTSTPPEKASKQQDSTTRARSRAKSRPNTQSTAPQAVSTKSSRKADLRRKRQAPSQSKGGKAPPGTKAKQ